MPSQQRPSRLHHYFPQFHLAYFTDARGELAVHDRLRRIRPNPRVLPPQRVAAEAGLYTDDHPEEPFIGLEEWLAVEIDGPAAEALGKVIARQDITPQQREAIARYVMSRDLRTPNTRDIILSDARSRIQAHWDARFGDVERVRAEILAQNGTDFTPDEIRALSQAYRPVVTKGFWLDFVKRHTQLGAIRLLSKTWIPIEADQDCRFVTTDVGILKHRGDFTNPVPYMPGWWTNAEGWMIPLTPRFMIAMAPGLRPTGKLAQAVFVQRFNALIVAQASEFSFATEVEDLISAIRTAGAEDPERAV